MENNLPNVLVCCPSSQDKDYCFQDYAKQVRTFNYTNYDVLICDNSKNEKYMSTYWRAGVDAVHIVPKGNPVQFVCDSQNILRDIFLRGPWDYMFMLESDVFVHKDTLLQLVSIAETNEAHVVGIPYDVFEKERRGLCYQSCNIVGAQQHFKMLTPEESFAISDGQIKDIGELKVSEDTFVYSAGTGALLISRDVLTHIPFMVDEKKHKLAFSDSYFGRDVMGHGFKYMIDPTIIAEHRNKNWDKKFAEHGIDIRKHV